MPGGAAPTDELEPQPVSDAELTELALAADPDTPVPGDAVSLWDLEGAPAASLLPAWYMPAPMPGRTATRRQRALIALIVASFLLINGYGMCSTYGWVGFN
jgi:hypothetical protein